VGVWVVVFFVGVLIAWRSKGGEEEPTKEREGGKGEKPRKGREERCRLQKGRSIGFIDEERIRETSQRGPIATKKPVQKKKGDTRSGGLG